MSGNQMNEYVTRDEFIELREDVAKGFEKTKKEFKTVNKRLSEHDQQFMEVRLELNHHSQLLTELKSDVAGLKGDVADLKAGQALHTNMLKQILEIVGSKN